MKNKLSMSLALLIALASGPAAALNQGDASAGNFSQACAGDIDAQRKATFFAEMDKADAALAAGQVDVAGAATMNAQRAVFRGGTMADDTSIRCLGTEATQRWFDTHLELWRRGSSYGLEGRSGDFGTLIVVAHDRGTQGLVEVATGRPVAGFREAYYAIKQILDRDDWQRQFGTPLLPDEKAVVKACRDALGPLDEYRGEEITRSLAAEADAFSRPMTAQEQQNVAQLNQASQLAEAIGGAGIMTS
ncbi:MAG: hypothetical protein ACR2QB_10755, partial [Gammaproteobacteria bacterium]